ncbi:hypothetical protein [Mycoplasma tauri]|uniref:hypothetical protein n=1 Tax=Mycoplasma tauri TaxID=547987 RepID=UPI001CBDE6F6|nr:hypothetical protein [Mycoplasma tauri]MBZ4203402.1 hypothetical protein [Mycoplasma tauri]
MDLKQYTKALFASENFENTNAYSLGERERSTVASYIVNNSLIGTMGEKLDLGSVSDATATFIKNVGQTFQNKEKLGPGEFEKAKYEKVSFHWNTPQYQAVGFSQADIALGLPTAFSIKLDKAAADYSGDFEEAAFKMLETEIIKTDSNIIKGINALLDGSKTADQLYDAIVNLGNELAKHKDKKDGINRIRHDDIIIHVKPEILQKISKLGMTGNNALQMFQGGQYAITTLGGYKVIANHYLDALDAIATTNFSVGSLVKVIAANYDRLAPTNDYGLYYEAMNLVGIAYKTCFKVIKKEA